MIKNIFTLRHLHFAQKFFEGENFRMDYDWTETIKDGITSWYFDETRIAERNANGVITLLEIPSKCLCPNQIEVRQTELIRLMKGGL